jgi:AraC family ethanolamine operon transcriptional activator
VTLHFPPQPLRLLDVGFTDVDDMCAAVRSWDLDFHPLSAQAADGKSGAITLSHFGTLEIGHSKFATTIEQFGAPPPGTLTFVVLEDTMQRLWWRGRDVDRDEVLVFPVSSELHSISGPDFSVHTKSVTEDTLAAICETNDTAPPHSATRTEVNRPPPLLLASLRARLNALHDTPGLAGMELADGIARSLVTGWLGHHAIRPRKRPVARARDVGLRRCMEAITGTGWETLTSATLRDIAGISERTLEYAFRERFALSPAALLKTRKLAEARRRLTSPADHTVGDIAAGLGFWHAGQFATDYRRAFGENPSATLARA